VRISFNILTLVTFYFSFVPLKQTFHTRCKLNCNSTCMQPALQKSCELILVSVNRATLNKYLVKHILQNGQILKSFSKFGRIIPFPVSKFRFLKYWSGFKCIFFYYKNIWHLSNKIEKNSLTSRPKL
jgi:hypothetical protein